MKDFKIRQKGSTLFHDFTILKIGEGPAHQFDLEPHYRWAWLYSLGKWACPTTLLTEWSFTPWWTQYDDDGTSDIYFNIHNMYEDHPYGLDPPDCCEPYFDQDLINWETTYYPRPLFWFCSCYVDAPDSDDYAAQWGNAYASLYGGGDGYDPAPEAPGWKISRLDGYADERRDDFGNPLQVRNLRIFFELEPIWINSEEVASLGDPAGHDTGWILRWGGEGGGAAEISVPSAAQGQAIPIDSVPDEIEWTNTGALSALTQAIVILSVQIETGIPEGLSFGSAEVEEP